MSLILGTLGDLSVSLWCHKTEKALKTVKGVPPNALSNPFNRRRVRLRPDNRDSEGGRYWNILTFKFMTLYLTQVALDYSWFSTLAVQYRFTHTQNPLRGETTN